MMLLAHRERDPATASDRPQAGEVNRLRVCPSQPLDGDEMAHLARLAMIGELAASLIHEITQPVAAMLVDAEAGRNWIQQGSDGVAEASSAFDRVTSHGERVSAIIAQTRSLARRCDPMPEKVSAPDMLRDVLLLVQPEAVARGVSIGCTVDPIAPILEVDRTQIVQVVINLLVNAIQASRPGTQVRIHCAPTAGGVEFRFEDDGEGIDNANLARLFDPFFTTKQDGLGLGLGICRSIVESHGGHIWAVSRVGEGSCFFFTLPNSRCLPPTPNADQAPSTACH